MLRTAALPVALALVVSLGTVARAGDPLPTELR
jgi:hypothetical protein